MSFVLGLTGGTGSGKTTIANYLKTLGAEIIDADQVAREVVLPNTVGLRRLSQNFGTDILKADGSLDRKKLGKMVFSDENKLTLLNQIMQPLILQNILEHLVQAKAAKLVVLDAPLLLEQHYQKYCDAVMVVQTSPQVQLKRIMARDHLTLNDAQKRIASQMAPDKRVELADVVIDSSKTVEETRKQVLKWLKISKIL
ncbi:dephospho-CoA kinase [Ligilactobacillus sp. WC1T17]|uniref:Dephospho-CoA kinase n=1 Tax=Ligilactobacillus ruminis TaxID=1623 RepID=A0ABY1A9P0_9LACO|nr:dephospho-CoA kinase [Ligilactobacillus ruminis]